MQCCRKETPGQFILSYLSNENYLFFKCLWYNTNSTLYAGCFLHSPLESKIWWPGRPANVSNPEQNLASELNQNTRAWAFNSWQSKSVREETWVNFIKIGKGSFVALCNTTPDILFNELAAVSLSSKPGVQISEEIHQLQLGINLWIPFMPP